MARFLTPAKIGLLALIELYIEEQVPNAAVLPVLSFITSHLLDHDPDTLNPASGARWTKAERAVSLVISIRDFETLLSAHPVLIGLPGRKLWDTFLDKLWTVDSLHQLHDFFLRQVNALTKPKGSRRQRADQGSGGIRLTRNSPFGVFVRRCQLEFARLQFHDSAELWKEFVKYRQPTIGHRRRRNPSFGRMSFDQVLSLGEQAEWDQEAVSVLASVAYGDMLTSASSAGLPVSTDDVELLLEFQIDQMQSKSRLLPVHWPAADVFRTWQPSAH
jgi:anaphase-promoting complex subunit 5